MSELRQLIREILVEELGKTPGPSAAAAPPRITEEQVTLRTNADLSAFVARLMIAAQDGRLRCDIEAGRHVFRLAETAPSPPLQAHQPSAPVPQAVAVVRFERGLVSERDVATLARGTTRIDVGRSVRFTPLARDELGRRGIRIERSSS